MAKDIKFNIKIAIDGQEQLVTASTSVAELRKNLQTAEGASTQLRNSFIAFNQHIEKLQNISNAVSQLAGVFNGVAKESLAFGKAMDAANTMAGKSGDDFSKLKDSVAELAESIPKTRDELANGLYQVISTGVPEDNWLEYLRQSARASVGGIADLGETVKVTSTIIKNYGLAWDAAGDVQDKIQLTAKYGVTSFEQLAQALPRVTGNAATLGVSINDLLAVFATLTGVSGNTAEVSTQLAAVFTALVKPSSEATKMAQQMGIEFNAASIKAAGGFQNFLADLDKSVKAYASKSGMLEQTIYGKLFGSAESLRALVPLVGELAPKFSQNVDNMADSVGTIDDAFSTMRENAEAQLQLLKNKLSHFTDGITSAIEMFIPALDMTAQVGNSIVSILALKMAMEKLGVAQKIAGVRTLTFNAACIAARSGIVGLTAVTRVIQGVFTGAAVGATTLKVAIRSLLISTGVGAAIVALTTILSAFSSKSAEAQRRAKETADMLKEAENAAAEASAQVKVQIDSEVKKLGELIRAKQDTTQAVNDLNAKYGDIFGSHAKASEWYDILINKSKNYIRQIGYEAQAKVLASKLAAKEIELESNYAKRRDLWKSGKARKTSTMAVGTSISGATQTATYGWDTQEYAELKKEGRGLLYDIRELRTQLGIAEAKVKDVSIDVPTPTPTPTPTPVTSTPKSGGHATATDKPEPLENSIAWYEKRLQVLREQITAAADEGVAKEKQAEYERVEGQLDDLKVRIGIEKAPETEVKNELQRLNDELQSAQEVFDATDPLNVEAKVKAAAKVADIQTQIDEATNGKVTIKADVEPGYIEQGSSADKIRSYENARSKVSRIQRNYEIGLIGKDEAKQQIAELNSEIAAMGLKPLELKLDASGFNKTMEGINQGWSSIQGIGNGIQGITDALEGNEDAWKQITGVINGFLSIASGIQGIVELIQFLTGATTAHAAAATTDAAATGADTAASTTNTAAKSGEAIASATASGAKMPFPMNLVAIAAGVAAVIAALAAVSGFATGGVIGGTSTSGDKKFARVNSGEMVLNKFQQARLFAMIDGKYQPPTFASRRLQPITIQNIASNIEPARTEVSVNLNANARKMFEMMNDVKRVTSRSGRKYDI